MTDDVIKGKVQLHLAVDLSLLVVTFSICSNNLFVEILIEL